MRYDKDNGYLLITARELVSIARRGISSTLPCDVDEPENSLHAPKDIGSEDNKSSELFLDFTLDEFVFRLIGKCRSTESGVYMKTAVDSSPRRPKKEVVMQTRGEAYINAYILSISKNLKSVEIEYLYYNPFTAEENYVTEKATLSKLENFFNKCKTSIKVYAKPEIERITVRVPSMKKSKFPYKNMRSGQKELIDGVYKSIAHSGTLFICAPTGTGKTVSVIYPAIRAIGSEKCDKVFYFTPKTTTANAAMDALNDIAATGAKIRALIMSSKERMCKNGLVCRENRLLCENTRENRLADAVLQLYNEEKTVIGPEDASRIAKMYSVCPHELSLSYAELCDVIILDINYLFDPDIYIRRFFSEGGEYAFLIDEAHNLPDRAREMYSASISEKELVSPSLSPIISEFSSIKNAARSAASEFYDVFMPYLKEDKVFDEDGEEKAATHLSEIPVELYGIFEKLLSVTEDEIFKNKISKDEEKDVRLSVLRDYYHKIKKFSEAITRFDSSYELFVFLEKNEISVRCFCIDPAKEISKRLAKGRCTVFFSGTLTPIHYYKSILGAQRNAQVIEAESPFDSGQLSVSIMDKISTRFSERERTLDAVCRAIAATVSAKRGNYMIFSPSFLYSEALFKKFSSRYPKIKVLLQKRNMTQKEKEDFLLEFNKKDKSYLVGFSVLGGIYSEGVDFAGESLIGCVIVGIGMPQLSYEREAMTAYYQDKFEEGKQFAYIYPGINRVLQAAGRVIRDESDRGVVVLIDDRFDDPLYKTVIPNLWKGMRFISDAKELRGRLDDFWQESEK